MEDPGPTDGVADPAGHAVAAAATAALSAVGDPDDASAMAAYMKSAIPFHGVKKPARTKILRQLATDHPVDDRQTYETTASALWACDHREEKYLAISWARRWKAFVDVDSLELYERFIVEGAWWDFVDETASHLVGRVLLDHRDVVRPIMEAWVDDPDLWRRRTAIICQLAHKEATDRDMLFDFCLRRAHEDEFFIRKAIGWALRQYARVEPGIVRSFVLDHRDAWSGLSFREATKHLDV
ncbi:MAG TPA: DNA alkylation repair protein [Nitriliruptoraceae bacterium]|nr:DNA alkylation repair protein [Nitriliruptoraceae bacterium]